MIRMIRRTLDTTLTAAVWLCVPAFWVIAWLIGRELFLTLAAISLICIFAWLVVEGWPGVAAAARRVRERRDRDMFAESPHVRDLLDRYDDQVIAAHEAEFVYDQELDWRWAS